MSTTTHNEELASRAFSRQSPVFDNLYSGNIIIQYKRQRVRDHVARFLEPGSDILELNSGTGEDAAWFAAQGHRVHATDISIGMQEILEQKIAAASLQEQVSTELISFTSLGQLQRKKEYDLIFSNFAGLNCTDQLGNVLQSFHPLLKPGGVATLVLLPKCCLWELLLVFRGRFKTAFRRWFVPKGAPAQVEGVAFRCWYYNPSFVTRQLKAHYEILGIEGLCTLVPPSYMENFPRKYPNLFAWLKKKEAGYKSQWPWRSVGDYYIISFRKK